MVELIGRFHPLLVHLPIGILLLVILFEWLPSKKRFRSHKSSIRIILMIGTSSAILSCLTGYLLSQNGEYTSELLSWHQWMGITLAVFSFGYYWIRKRYKPFRKSFSFFLLILLILTGHLGGSLTHGEGYLTSGITSGASFDVATVNLPQALFYDDLVKPILEDKCYGCHGASKQKGKLRLDEPQHILKGGKDGVVLVAGKIDESEMIDRMLLPMEDEDHMPPKEKKQLSEKEIEILKIWIASGADFKKSVKDAGQLTIIQKIISSEKSVAAQEIPSDEIRAADQTALRQLQKLGVVIVPVALNSHYLSANLINTTSLDSALDLLIKVKEQLIWLKTGGQPVTDNHLTKLIGLNKLTRLNLDHAKITDAGLSQLKSLTKLQYLNLNENQITAAGLTSIKGLTELNSVYLYHTLIRTEEAESLKKHFPHSVIEAGDYVVPALADDTIVLKAPLKN